MKLLPLIFTTIFLVGNVYGDVSVDAQIEQIMNAPANERVGLMNQLKIKLAGMNNSERNEALQKLQGDTNHGWSNGSAMIHTGFTSAPMQQMNTNTQMQPINKVPMQNQGQR